MKKAFSVFLLLVLSSLLIVSTVSASELIGDNDDITNIIEEDQSADNSLEIASGNELVDNSCLNEDDPLCATDSLSYIDSVGATDSTSSVDSNADLPYSSTDKSTPLLSTDSTLNSNNVPYRFTSTRNISAIYSNKVNFYVKVLNRQGKAINHTLVTFKASNKTYKIYTNERGIACLTLNYYAGNYFIRYYAGNISGKNTYLVRNYYRLTYYKWNSGADVLKNQAIKRNVPDSALVRRLIRFAKYGTPLIKFRGGVGKTVFITAGVHGNEIPSQIAALNLVKYLQNHPINGTVYVMPFMNPKGTAANVRDYNGYHLNKNANKKGSISYKTVQLIKNYKCDAYGDFHATRPGGKPGKDVAMGTYNPTKNSAVMAKYISKNAKVSCIIYKKAGAEYPGAIEDEVNLKGIPAVTCEVLSPHGKIKAGSVYKSLLMMRTLLKYNKLL